MKEQEMKPKKSWLQKQNFAVRFNLFLIPAYVIMLVSFWSIEDMSILMKILSAFFIPLAVIAGSLLLFSIGATIFSNNDTTVDTVTVQVCSFCIAHAFSIYAACGSFIKEYRADRRDEMIDRAEQNLKESGKRATFKELKAELREIEKNTILQ